MRIDDSSHEQAGTGRVFGYRGDYEVDGDAIRWRARARQGEQDDTELEGTIPATTPAAATLAEQLVRDAIVREIDALAAN